MLDVIKNFIDKFSRLPSIGQRQATRLAFYLSSFDEAELKNLELAIAGLRNLSHCEKCFALKNKDKKICDVCSSSERDKSVIAIIEKETDLISIEETHNYKGIYFIIGELSKRGRMENIQKLKLDYLKKRIETEFNGKAKEIILALNPNTFGDFASQLIFKELTPFALKITRLGKGIPTGGEIEFADRETLASALKGRN